MFSGFVEDARRQLQARVRRRVDRPTHNIPAAEQTLIRQRAP
jgi:hypothetical protein